MSNSFYPPSRILMGPGPSDVSPRVLGALSRPTIGHLDPEFVALMDQIKVLLLERLDCDTDLRFVRAVRADRCTRQHASEYLTRQLLQNRTWHGEPLPAADAQAIANRETPS